MGKLRIAPASGEQEAPKEEGRRKKKDHQAPCIENEPIRIRTTLSEGIVNIGIYT